MIPPPGDDLDLDTLVLQAVRWRVPDRTYKTRDYLYPQSLATMTSACQRPDLLAELLRAGTKEGLTQALDQAIWWYSDPCIDLLLKNGVVPSDNALAMALKDSRWPLLLRLLQHGGNLQARFQGEATLLHLATWQQNLEATTGLLKLNVPVDAQDVGGRTPLLRACERWRPATAEAGQEIVLQLLENRANPNTQDNRGMTALMLAAATAEPEFLSLLCLAGANPNLRNHDGIQAWEIAQAAKKPENVARLHPTP